MPARIVTGYQGGERNNGVDGFWTLRQSDAHAWAEGLGGGRRLGAVDPTSAVAPGRTAPSNACARRRGAVAAALAWWSAPRGGPTARGLGSRQQPLEPVGAELHAKQTARPAEEPRLQLAQLEDLAYVLLGLLVA